MKCYQIFRCVKLILSIGSKLLSTIWYSFQQLNSTRFNIINNINCSYFWFTYNKIILVGRIRATIQNPIYLRLHQRNLAHGPVTDRKVTRWRRSNEFVLVVFQCSSGSIQRFEESIPKFKLWYSSKRQCYPGAQQYDPILDMAAQWCCESARIHRRWDIHWLQQFSGTSLEDSYVCIWDKVTFQKYIWNLDQRKYGIFRKSCEELLERQSNGAAIES